MSNILSAIYQLIDELSVVQMAELKGFITTAKMYREIEELSVSHMCESKIIINFCPHCKSYDVIGHGNYKDRKRYQCKTCNRTFNTLTGTVWHYLHFHDKFKKFIKLLAQKASLRDCVAELEICMATAFYWRHKLLIAFEHIGGKEKLKQYIEADETFIPENKKGCRQKLERPAKKRGRQGASRGISNDSANVLCAIDKLGTAVIVMAGMGKLTKKMVKCILFPRIRKQRVNSATFVTDRNNAYNEIVKEKKLSHQTIAASYGQYVNTQGYSLAKINNLHQRFKSWLVKFCGVATRHLQKYADYFRLFQKSQNSKERFKNFFTFLAFKPAIFTRNCDI